MAQVQNFTWDQGEDLDVQLIYKEGADAASAVAIDLSSNYAVRMDIVAQGTKERLYTFNSDDIADVDLGTTGDQPDTLKEGTLTSGAGGTPNISITVPRRITLPPDGELYTHLASGGSTVFNYDVFLRNTTTNKQVKVLTGTITVSESYTLWL